MQAVTKYKKRETTPLFVIIRQHNIEPKLTSKTQERKIISQSFS